MRPKRPLNGTVSRAPSGGAVEVCTAAAELRELTLIVAALVARCVALLMAPAPPDVDTFTRALAGAHRAALRTRDFARLADDAEAGRLPDVN